MHERNGGTWLNVAGSWNEYCDDQDIVQSSRELGWVLKCARELTDKDCILLCHSMGGIVCRHYTVSNWFVPGSIDRLLMVGTPNHGTNRAILHFDGFDADGDGTAARQLLAGSDFIMVLNRQTSKAAAHQFMIKPGLQNSQGINPDVPCAIIAGEVVQKTIQDMKKAGIQTSLNMEILFEEFLKLLRENFAITVDSEAIKKWLYEFLSPILEKINNSLSSIPGSDLIVPLNSALIPGVPTRIINFVHGQLLEPGGVDDIRYVLK